MKLGRRKAIKLYLNLIIKRIREPLKVRYTNITEVHHIIPRCICKWLSNSKYNVVRLYSHEHFLAHYYLTLIFPKEPGIQRAFYLMCNLRNKKRFKNIEEMAKAYEVAKRVVIKRRKHKTYAQLYGNSAAAKIKIKQKKKKLDMMIRIIHVDK